MNYDAIFFDLDGTLLDTAPDLSAALNQVLKDHNKAPVPYLEIRSHVHTSSKTILSHVLNVNEMSSEYEAYKAAFHEYYAACLTARTNYFPEMEAVLNTLDQLGFPWGIVTNKPERFSFPLLNHFGLIDRSIAVVSGDTLKKAKPHPDPLIHACDLTSHDPQRCLYVGDSLGDVNAARAATMDAAVALYGYIPLDEDPRTWPATHFIQAPKQILKLL